MLLKPPSSVLSGDDINTVLRKKSVFSTARQAAGLLALANAAPLL